MVVGGENCGGKPGYFPTFDWLRGKPGYFPSFDNARRQAWKLPNIPFASAHYMLGGKPGVCPT